MANQRRQALATLKTDICRCAEAAEGLGREDILEYLHRALGELSCPKPGPDTQDPEERHNARL